MTTTGYDHLTTKGHSRSISRRSHEAAAIKAKDLRCVRDQLGYGQQECDPAEAWQWLAESIRPKLWVLAHGWQIEICNELSFNLTERSPHH